MIWFIAKKEFRGNIVTPGFVIGLLLCLALIPYTVYSGIQTYKSRLSQYETDVKTAEDIYQKSHVYSEVNPVLVKPVSPLSIFRTGIAEQTGSIVQLDYMEKQIFPSDIASTSGVSFLESSSFDFVTAIAILLSLLGILFSYDMLSREKEQGTLQLALSNPVSRSTFFLGKIAGIFLTLTPILLICFLVILLIIQFSPAVQFSPDDYGRIGILLFFSLVYFGFFVFLGGFISSCVKSSTASIILNLFIWCFLLFLLPNAASYIGKTVSKVDDYMQIRFNTAQIDKYYMDVQSEKIEETLKNENLEHIGMNGSIYMVMFTPRPTMEYLRRRHELRVPILMENCDKKWAIQSNYLQQLYRQEKTVSYLSCLSPAGILKQIAASLCRTGVDSEVHFMEQTRLFHDVFYGYYVQNRIFSSYEYITMQKESEFPNDWDEARAQRKNWENKARPERWGDYSAIEPLDTRLLPRFDYVQPTLGYNMYEQLYLIAGILIACILLFWLSFISFIKYDVR